MIKIITLTVTHFSQNCRLLFDSQSRSVLIIDPGGEADRIFSALQAELSTSSAFTPESIKIVLTHAHIDHGGGVKVLMKKIEEFSGTKADLLFHADCDSYRETIEQQVLFFGLPPGEYKNVPAADKYLTDNEVFAFGEHQFKILFTPGHAPGHIALFLKAQKEIEEEMQEEIWEQGASFPRSSSFTGPLLIGGDVLFRGSIGRTDLPGGDHQTLLKSISEKIMGLPPETLVMAGHGPNTTVGHEIQFNPFLTELQGPSSDSFSPSDSFSSSEPFSSFGDDN